jgi:hypothetical protein
MKLQEILPTAEIIPAVNQASFFNFLLWMTGRSAWERRRMFTVGATRLQSPAQTPQVLEIEGNRPGGIFPSRIDRFSTAR